MTSRLAAPNAWNPYTVRTLFVPLLRAVLCAATGLLLALAAAFALRRLLGFWTRPLSGEALLLAVPVVVAVVTGLRAGWWSLLRLQTPAVGRRAADLAWAASSAIVLSAAVALSIPGSPGTPLVVFWLLLLLEEAGAWSVYLAFAAGSASCWRSGSPDSTGRAADADGGAAARLHPEQVLPDIGAAAEALAEDGSELLPPDVSQQITRSRSHTGEEIVSGLLRGELIPGQRSLSLHVAFCPPLARTPTVHAMLTDGPDCSVKAAEVRAHGARFDIRLAAAPENRETVLVYFEAQAPAENGEKGL